ncbi:MAG: ribosomal protein S18-alanine N-acetyltransferase [Candidatus Bathyarchaeia archaeon]
MAVTVESATLKHLDRLYEIEKMCFKNEAFLKRQIAQLLISYNSVSLIAKENGDIIGFIIGIVHVENEVLTGHILTMDVAPDYRRKGVGIKLLQEIEKIFMEKGVKICCLEVREDNIPALNLYRKLGYKKTGRLENYYGKAHGIALKKILH